MTKSPAVPFYPICIVPIIFIQPLCLLQGSLEEQLGRLREYEEAVYQFKPHLEELERINQQIQESFVFENRYTQYTMETLRVGWEQLVTSVNRTINEVENQVNTSSILTP